MGVVTPSIPVVHSLPNVYNSHNYIYIPYSGEFLGVLIFVKSSNSCSEIIFVVLNFVTRRSPICGVEIFVGRNFHDLRVSHEIKKNCTPPKMSHLHYIVNPNIVSI